MIAITILFVTAIAVLFLGLFGQRSLLLPVALVGLAAAILAVCPWCPDIFGESSAFGKYEAMLKFDGFANGFSAIAILATFLVVAMSGFGFRNLLYTLGDHLGLILMSLTGALCMVGFQNMVMLFIGIEILSIPIYVLAGSRRSDLGSNEAALKYFLMGAFATGIFLFGTALIYGASGSFHIGDIAATLSGGTTWMTGVGMALLIIGLGFKVSAVPFHFWAPDVYEGAPNMITAYMATVVKVAGLAAIYKLFTSAFGPLQQDWVPIFAILSALSMTIGNITAIFQSNFKRMMAFSGISHAGYMLMALVAAGVSGSASALLLYLGVYAVASIIAFGVYISVSEQNADDQSFTAFHGLSRRSPFLAFAMAFAILTLAGIPPMAGFFGKYFLFSQAFQIFPWLVIVAIINSAISIYYYFKVIIAMYFTPSDQSGVVSAPMPYTLVLAGAVAVILLLTILPGRLMSVLG